MRRDSIRRWLPRGQRAVAGRMQLLLLSLAERFHFREEFVDDRGRPGWGAEPNEEAIRAPPKGPAGLLHYGKPRV